MKEIIVEEKLLGGVYAQEVRGEIVRCKDCKHQADNGRRYKDCEIHFLIAKDDWFCADGERKE